MVSSPTSTTCLTRWWMLTPASRCWASGSKTKTSTTVSPGRHQEQASKQRCTFRPSTFSSVQFTSATTHGQRFVKQRQFIVARLALGIAPQCKAVRRRRGTASWPAAQRWCPPSRMRACTCQGTWGQTAKVYQSDILHLCICSYY